MKIASQLVLRLSNTESLHMILGNKCSSMICSLSMMSYLARTPPYGFWFPSRSSFCRMIFRSDSSSLLNKYRLYDLSTSVFSFSPFPRCQYNLAKFSKFLIFLNLLNLHFFRNLLCWNSHYELNNIRNDQIVAG